LRAADMLASDGRRCGHVEKAMKMNSLSPKPDIATAEEFRDEQAPDAEPLATPRRRSAVVSWLVEDSPYIAMLALALVGLVLRMPAGWRHFETREARIQLVYSQALSWLTLIVAIYVLYNDGVQGVLNENSISLAMITLLALGTVMAGLQARVWRICAVGGILFLAAPAVGWVDQSAVLLMVATLAVIGIGGLTWWVSQRRRNG
jgi:hypothetical protein